MIFERYMGKLEVSKRSVGNVKDLSVHKERKEPNNQRNVEDLHRR